MSALCQRSNGPGLAILRRKVYHMTSMISIFRALSYYVVCSAMAVLAAAASAQTQVTTYHNDNLRSGLNSNETVLNPSNVNPATFGVIFSQPVDGQVYAQPLYLHGVSIAGKGVHNVVFVATEHNSVYAFDADFNSGMNAQPLWHVNFGPSVPCGDTQGYPQDIQPEIGITGTPVIYTLKSGRQVLFVVSKTKTFAASGSPIYTQKLHALSVSSGAEQLNGPLVIGGTVPGLGDASIGGFITFNPLIQHNRAALLVVPSATQDSHLYVAYASHGDNGPYHGWLFVYDADKLKLISIVSTTPNGKSDPSGYPIAAGGIWQGGCGPASDGVNVYFATGNGSFNPANLSYGDSVLRVNDKTMRIEDYFTPSDQYYLDDNDADVGSGGVMLLPASATGPSKANLLVQCGKDGTVHLLNTANLGGYHAVDTVYQELTQANGGVWGAPAFFNNTVYFGPQYSSILAFTLSNGRFTSPTASAGTQVGFAYPGPTPSISSNGLKNGIVWAIQVDGYSSGQPGILHAFATDTFGGPELYNSTMAGGRDTLGAAVKFTTPTVVNGKVYVGSTGSFFVHGLSKWAASPSISPPTGTYSGAVAVTLSDSTPGASIRYTLDGTVPTPTSPLYTRPISVTGSTTLQARAFLGTIGGSAPVENNYLIGPVIGNGSGLFGAYYNGVQIPTGTPTATEIDPSINFFWNGNSPIAGVAGTNWAGEWTGQIQAETTGTYTLTTNSDDGVEVFINGQLVINGYVYQPPTLYSGTVTFQAGQLYNIDIVYFQGGGGSVLQLFWAAPGLPQQIVPTTQLYPASPGLIRKRR